MAETAEQSTCIKYCQKLEQSCSETYDMIQKVFGNRQRTVRKLRSDLNGSKRDGHQLSDERSGSLSTSRNQLMIDKVHSAMLHNCRITVTELSDELGLSFGSVQSILTEDLGMKLLAKSVPNC
jgi:hypothetical protein